MQQPMFDVVEKTVEVVDIEPEPLMPISEALALAVVALQYSRHVGFEKESALDSIRDFQDRLSKAEGLTARINNVQPSKDETLWLLGQFVLDWSLSLVSDATLKKHAKSLLARCKALGIEPVPF